MKLPFEPSVYEHAVRFVRASPWNVSRDPDLLFRAHRDAWLEYRHNPIVVGIDIYNLEAEAYGAVIDRPEGNAIPSVRRPLVGAIEGLTELAPPDPRRDGRLPMIIEVGKRLRRSLPGADVRIPIAGPFSIAFNLRGIEGLCEDVALNSPAASAALRRIAKNQAPLLQEAAAAGLDVAFFESAAAPPILSPRQFHEIEMPALSMVLRLASEAVGHPVPCIVGGDTFPVIDDILETGTGMVICNVETDQQGLVDHVCRSRPGVKIRINMDPGIVAGTDRSALVREIERIRNIAAGRANCMMGTGCLPLETPPENIHFIRKYLASP